MTELSDFKRIIYEPEIAEYHKEIQQLKHDLKAWKERAEKEHELRLEAEAKLVMQSENFGIIKGMRMAANISTFGYTTPEYRNEILRQAHKLENGG